MNPSDKAYWEYSSKAHVYKDGHEMCEANFRAGWEAALDEINERLRHYGAAVRMHIHALRTQPDNQAEDKK